jgi:hypothetical protein
MVDHSEQRKHVRLPGKGSAAEKFSGESIEDLPGQATVSDISQGGVGLKFHWPMGSSFPLERSDGLGFRLRIKGTGQTFELMSVVRHVVPEIGGGVRVGVQFWGLDRDVRESLKKAVLDLAVTSLRKWRGSKPGEEADEDSPEAAAGLPRSETKRRKLYLGEILVKQGALDGDRLEKFISEEFTGRRRLGEELSGMGLVDDRALAKALAEQARLTFVDLDESPPDMVLVSKLSQEVFTKHWAIPVRDEDGVLLIALNSPPDLKVFDEFKEVLSRRIRVGIAPADKLSDWLKRAYNLEGAPHPSAMTFKVQLHAEYRILSADWKKPVDPKPNVGLTREISHTGMVIAGPLPEGFSPERIAREDLKLAVRISCPELSQPMAMGCAPDSVKKSEYSEEYHLECSIQKFPKDGETAWARLCMVRGTQRFHPGSF